MSLSTLLVLADGRLPSGAHAHSGGVEAAVAAGRVHDVPTLESFLLGRTATTGVVSAAFAAATCHVLIGPCVTDPISWPGGDRDSVDDACWARVRALDDGLDVRTASPTLRAASRAQGRALLRAVARIWPDVVQAANPAAASHLDAASLSSVLRADATVTAPGAPGLPAQRVGLSAGRARRSVSAARSHLPAGVHHPTAIGIAAAAAGLGPREAGLIAVYGGLTGAASAAVRLLGLDPYAVHGLVAALAQECDRVAADAALRVDDPVDDLPAGSALLLDVDAEQHATWEVRLFAS